jgi:hypothetical protein
MLQERDARSRLEVALFHFMWLLEQADVLRLRDATTTNAATATTATRDSLFAVDDADALARLEARGIAAQQVGTFLARLTFNGARFGAEELKLHFFDDEVSEPVLHSHASHLVSLCLHGGYVEQRYYDRPGVTATTDDAATPVTGATHLRRIAANSRCCRRTRRSA